MLNADGYEVPDPMPVAKPIGWKEPESLQSMIARLIRTEVSRRAAELGEESFEDADDFDVDDDPELKSPYELDDATAGLEKWKEDEQRQRAIREAEERFVSSMPDPAKPDAPPAGAKPSSEGKP